MYILELNQNGIGTEIGVFDSIEDGRKFISKLKGYKFDFEDEFLYEYILLDTIPDYLELEYNNNIIPLTKFMFVENGRIDIIWKEIPNLSKKGNGIVSGCTRVDAYHIDNKDLKEYIENRERKYSMVKQYLEENNFEVSRAYFGSEDGEAILYRKINTENWHFLTHLDPMFSEMQSIEEILEDIDFDNLF